MENEVLEESILKKCSRDYEAQVLENVLEIRKTQNPENGFLTHAYISKRKHDIVFATRDTRQTKNKTQQQQKSIMVTSNTKKENQCKQEVNLVEHNSTRRK